MTKVQAPRTIQCPIHPPHDKWCVLCVYISGVIALYSPGKGAKPTHLLPDVHFVKSVQIGASLLLRGIYTSDNHYLLDDLPREMQPTHKEVEIGWIEVPINSSSENPRDDNKIGSDTTDSIMTRLEANSPEGTPAAHKLSARQEQTDQENEASLNMDSNTIEPIPRQQGMKAISLIPPTSMQLKQVVCARPQLGGKNMSRKTTASQRRFAVWVRDQQSSQKPVVCASSAGHLSLSSINSTVSREPRLISGSGLVACLAGADSGNTVITAEAGTPPVIRLWRPTVSQTQPVCIIACPMLAGVEDICSDADSRRLCIVGKDAQRKQQQLFLWSIPNPPTHTPGRAIVCKPAELVAKQLCGAWPIQAMKFSPFRPWNVTSIVSCGFENIRFWRAKDQHLAGVSVQLNQLARDTVFTDLDFEASKSLRPAVGVEEEVGSKEADAVLYYRVFVSTACGRVVQIHYNTRQIENVFRLHEDGCPIWAISVTEGFVCTAGGDGFVRVWPLDFTNYYMQAKVRGAINSITPIEFGIFLA
ncbi:WD repeat domain 90 [Perkinsus chesapeaki]|uniref:WD repeat domain 90 n=1 Tax=Perkinsus chesapeaki TaxID=330153 RepID=A0A7J6M6B6_PERCH|nr:WD repeat domain 90 [Perkinsus chesapeaki]